MREAVYRALVDYAPPILLNNRYIANFIENHAIKKREYNSRELMAFSVLPTENMRRVYRHILDIYSKGDLRLKQSEYNFFKLLILGYGTMRLFDWPERIKIWACYTRTIYTYAQYSTRGRTLYKTQIYIW
ncbi:MAG: hypothetical protein QXS53_02235 [Candidatus Anstonellales archaeon]